ncbi:membrane protein [Nocardiopsis valliformis]|uniref:membrane protein n=1 Tax=Nocardiopsis valliformis TaxID=239974 RepID=UPI000348CD16|nr:membrane protein [Nocardiopsis valliformis]
MGRLLLKVAAGVAAVIALFWLLSVIIGLLVWVVMIALVVGIVFLGVRMLNSESSGR